MPLPPGPRTPAAIGLLLWMRSPARNFEQMFAEYGDLYTVQNPIVGTEVVISHPEHIKTVLTGSPEVFLGGAANRLMEPVVGARSVLLLAGRAHPRERKLLLPPFHGERLAAYAAAVRDAAERVIAAWPRGKKFSLLPSMQRITLDVILEAVFGVREGADMDRVRAVLAAILERAQSPLGMLWMHPALQRDLGPLTGWAALKRSIEAADDVIYGLIARARAGGARGTDILSMLLGAVDEEGNPMTDAELRDELITLLFAGHETTAPALCWGIEEIVRRPEVHARIVAEAREAGASAEAPYLDATIKEVLRLRPLAPLLVRKLAAPITLGGYDLPAGILLAPCIYLAHRHPDYWDEPAAFRPERFLGKKPDPYAWLPFGGGARRCIGMALALYEMRIILGLLLTRVPIRLPDAPAKIALRSFLFAPSRGPRVGGEPAGAAVPASA